MIKSIEMKRVEVTLFTLVHPPRHLGRLCERRKKNGTATEDAETSSNLYHLPNREGFILQRA